MQKIGDVPDFLLFLIFFQHSDVFGSVQQILVLFKARIEVRVDYPSEKVFLCDRYAVGEICLVECFVDLFSFRNLSAA